MTKTEIIPHGKSALRAAMRAQDARTPQEVHEALFKAAALGQSTTVDMLLPKVTDLEVRDAHGRTALIWAAMNGHPAVVNILLDRGAKIDAKDELDRTPLMWASVNGHIATVRVLILRAANLHAQDKESATALTLASAKDHKQIVSQLTQAGAVLGSWDDWNANPRARLLRQMPGGTLASGSLPGVAVVGSIPKIKRDGSKVIAPSKSLKEIRVHIAHAKVEHGQAETLINAKSVSLEEKLIEIAKSCDYSRSYMKAFAIPLMTKGKVRVDAGDHVERIGIDEKDWLDHQEAEELLEAFLNSLSGGSQSDNLASNGAGEAHPMTLGNAAMMRAAMEGRTTTLKILVEEGTDVNSRLLDGWTPLMCSSWNGHGACVKALIELGADIEARGADGWTALMIAAWNGHADIVKLLLDEKANVSACDNNGKSVLMWAVQNGNVTGVKILLAKKPDVNARSSSGKTALYYAKREQHAAIARLLERAGARE